MRNIILGIDPLFEKFEASIEWIGSVFSLIWQPLLIGTLVIGVISAILGYLAIHLIWKFLAYRKLKKIKHR